MKYIIEEKDLQIELFDISVTKSDLTDLFINKKTTLSSILKKKEYEKFRNLKAIKNYQESTPIGYIIADLKKNEDESYKNFLNKHGDLNYCEFSVVNAPEVSGVYFIIVENQIKYVGRCGKTNFKKRFKDYGKISPTNVYRHGQSTNCHINSLINSCQQEGLSVKIGLHAVRDVSKVIDLEKEILSSGSFEWNIQKR